MTGEPVEITVAAVGDVLPHRKVKSSAAEHGWASVFGDAIPLLQAADLAFGNLEAPVAPDAQVPVHDEVFDAPASLLTGLVSAGFDVVSTANNHAFDQGPDGLVETWTRARAAGLPTVGSGPDRVRARSPWIAEVKGVKVAFLALADLSNIDGNTGPDAAHVFFAGDRHCDGVCGGVDRDAVHYTVDWDRVSGAIATARALADVTIVSFHWGNEYQNTPLPEYDALARRLVDAGVDVVLGHHPHVLQPIERIARPDGSHAVVAWSLGNFVSNMQNARTRDGVLLGLTISVGADGRVDVGEPRPTPLWTENDAAGIRVRTLDALEAQATTANDAELQELVTRRRAAIAGAIHPRP